MNPSDEKRRRKREYKTEQRRRAVAAGLCGQCCTNRPPDGRRMCDRCLDYSRQRLIRNKANGVCACGNAKLPGHFNCANCRERQIEYRKLGYAVARSQGLCGLCWDPADGAAVCARCGEKQAARRRATRASRAVP